MRASALICAIAIALLVAPAGARQKSAQEVATALQAKYDQIRDFSADFTQHYQTMLKRKMIPERGKVQVKKPGKMRWDYTQPDKKLFVSDGSQIYLWVPADNQVTRSAAPKDDEATTAILFLAGKGKLTRDFNVSFAPKAPEGTYALHLEPKLPERDYEWLELVIDQKTFQIRGLTAEDRQGGRMTFEFSHFRENTGIPDSVFAFKIPKGADVIDPGRGTR